MLASVSVGANLGINYFEYVHLVLKKHRSALCLGKCVSRLNYSCVMT